MLRVLALLLLVGACATVPTATTTSPPAASSDRFASFWAWWSEARPRIEGHLRAGQALPEALLAEIDAQVKRIDPEMSWELGGSPASGFELSLSSDGDLIRRRLSEAWLATAPKDGWRYHPARPATRDFGKAGLKVSGHAVEFGELVVFAELVEARARFDVTVFHPAFAAMSEEDRDQVSLLALDALLGEDGVERWIGGIDPVVTAPPGGVAPAAFAARVVELAGTPRKNTFTVMQNQDEPRISSIDLGLKPLDYLDLVWHVEITLPLSESAPNGLPSRRALEAARASVRELRDVLDAEGIFYGQTVAGGQLVFFAYVADPADVAAELEAWKAKHAGATIVTSQDPTWEKYDRF